MANPKMNIQDAYYNDGTQDPIEQQPAQEQQMQSLTIAPDQCAQIKELAAGGRYEDIGKLVAGMIG